MITWLSRVFSLTFLFFWLAGCQVNPGTSRPVPVETSAFPPPSATQTLPDRAVPVTGSTPETTAVGSNPTATRAAASETTRTPTVSDMVKGASPADFEILEFPVPAGSHPHDVAPAPDGSVWYTAQATGELGRLDPKTGKTHTIPLGKGSAPHGVIVGPDQAAWVTDGGLNAIVRVDAATEAVKVFPLPDNARNANLNTAAFDPQGILWFTGQSGYYGRLDPASGSVEAYPAPNGIGPYGIAITPDGKVFYASLAGSYLGRIDPGTRQATVIQPPTPGQGARRVWADSKGRLWVSEWNAAQVAVFDPKINQWHEWRLPGSQPLPYAVYVDDQDVVWLSDFGGNAIVRFDPEREAFTMLTLPGKPANVRQILGRPGEIWGAESGVDRLILIRLK